MDKEPVSKLCDELALQPTGSTAGRKSSLKTEPLPSRPTTATVASPQERIERLEKKIRTKDEVLAELMAEHIALKKSLGEL